MLPHHGRMPPAIPARSPLRPRPSLSASLTVDNDEDTQQMTLASLIDKEKPLPEPEQEQNKEDTTPPLTKRQHALHELLSSERAYASDLALIREVHIPLALGKYNRTYSNLVLPTHHSRPYNTSRQPFPLHPKLIWLFLRSLFHRRLGPSNDTGGRQDHLWQYRRNRCILGAILPGS